MSKEKVLIEIRIAGLSEGTHEYDFTCKASDFKNPELATPGFCNKIWVRVVANKTNSEITVTIETKTVAEFSCDICLVPLKKELTGFYRIFFVFGDSAGATGEHEENYRVLDSNAPAIDLTEDVRETLLLSKPMKVVCIDNPECSIYRDGGLQSREQEYETKSSWKESLEKLKDKYR